MAGPAVQEHPCSWRNMSTDADPRIRNRPLLLPRAPAPVDDAAQDLEQLRRAVDLVQDDEPIFEVVEEQGGLGEPVAIVASLQIEIGRIARSPARVWSCRPTATRSEPRRLGESGCVRRRR